jgi:hypothetical protein
VVVLLGLGLLTARRRAARSRRRGPPV